MSENDLKRIIKMRMVQSRFMVDAGVVDSLMDFIKKLKISLPSKEKALKKLEKYSPQDIEQAYAAIPDILKAFKFKKADEASDDAFYSNFQKKMIKNFIILIFLVSVVGGFLPKNPQAAYSEILETEKKMYTNFDYIGKVSLADVKKVIDAKDPYSVTLRKIKEGIKNTKIPFIGYKLPAGDLKIYKDRDDEVKSTKDLLSYGGIYLKLAK